jgi:hypothetical protein
MTITATGYMIQDKQGNAIFGIGETVDEAWAHVVDEAGPFFDINGDEKLADVAFAEDFRVYGATVALMQKVRDHGGAITWDVVGGVACTVEENEEA